MKLSELNSKSELDRFFQRELKEYKRLLYWHNAVRRGDSSAMSKYFRDFILFRRKVLDDLDIEQAFIEWVGVSEYTPGPYYNQNEMRKKMNVPQLSFFECYEGVKSRTLLQRKRENEV